MLRELYIKNFAVIDDLRLFFDNGFNVITGETGAGKSVIVESLAFLFGSRFSFKDIKKEIYVKANFKKEKKEYLIERVYDKNGKSKYFLNRKQVPYYEIEKLKSILLDFHSQMENIALFNNDYQLSLIDRYLGIDDKVKNYIKLFDERKEILDKLAALSMSEAEREKKLEIINFQIDEIESANIKPGEDLVLEEKISNYKNKSKIMSVINFLNDTFYGENGAFDLISKVKRKAEDLNELGEFSDLLAKIELIYDNVNELKDILREKSSLYNFDDDIDKLIERDNLIKRLKKKYNVFDSSELLAVLESLKRELNGLLSLNIDLGYLRNKLSEVESEMNKIALEISRIRKEGSAKLSKDINSVLKDLDLKNAKFEVFIESTNEYLKNGKDIVEFLFSSSLDFPLKPLKYVLSGGEMSRIMVAIKYVFSGIEQPSTMILDEIDAGTGGNTAFKMGRVIREISKTTQIICITHLPQIAVFANNHIKVEKEFDLKKTVIEAKTINSEDERVNEIARMFGSEYSSDTAFKHAMELLKRCKNF